MTKRERYTIIAIAIVAWLVGCLLVANGLHDVADSLSPAGLRLRL